MKVKILIKAKRCNTEFKKGLGKGILASQEIEMNVENKVLASHLLLEYGDELLNDTVKIIYEEVK